MTDSEQVKAALAALADGDAARDAETGEPATGGPANEPAARKRPAGRTVSDRPAEHRAVIEQASSATDDVEAAAAFVEEIGVDRLETAVAEAEREVSGLAEDGRAALAAFEQFRAAADGSADEHRRG